MGCSLDVSLGIGVSVRAGAAVSAGMTGVILYVGILVWV